MFVGSFLSLPLSLSLSLSHPVSVMAPREKPDKPFPVLHPHFMREFDILHRSPDVIISDYGASAGDLCTSQAVSARSLSRLIDEQSTTANTIPALAHATYHRSA